MHWWRDQLVGQLDFYWENHLWPRLEGLTDEEFFWEPVPGCWTVRPDGEAGAIDWEFPAPEPPPVTTIAWRTAHLAVLAYGMRASMHFGDGSFTLDAVRWPASAAEGLESLRTQHFAWRNGVAALDDEALQRPVGAAEPGWESEPMATLVLHLNREVMHHGAEIALLRDLYRAGGEELSAARR